MGDAKSRIQSWPRRVVVEPKIKNGMDGGEEIVI